MPDTKITDEGIYVFNWKTQKYKFISLETLEKYNTNNLLNHWITKIKQKQENILQEQDDSLQQP